MKTSQKEYNELLYVINDPNNLTEDAIYYRIPAIIYFEKRVFFASYHTAFSPT